ncbi:hypothetical protein DPSP01_012629 [Paraphaeosphaeria sporulosa]
MKSSVKLALEQLNTYVQKLAMPAEDNAPSLYCVATTMHPCLCLSWFKSQWRDLPYWHKAAEKSIWDFYNKYLAAEDVADDPDELAELARTRKVPGAYASDERTLRTMWADDHLLTGKKPHK